MTPVLQASFKQWLFANLLKIYSELNTFHLFAFILGTHVPRLQYYTANRIITEVLALSPKARSSGSEWLWILPDTICVQITESI